MIGPYECNNIIRGDSFDLIAAVPDASVNLVLTDPPYDWDGPRREGMHHELLRVSKGQVIVFCAPENLWHYPADQYLFWIKPTSTKNTSKHYSRFVEMILVYGEGKWNAGRHWSQYTNVFTDLVEGRSTHPHEKPLSLLARLIQNHTDEGDIILDPFAGSGSTLKVAEILNRQYLGFEL